MRRRPRAKTRNTPICVPASGEGGALAVGLLVALDEAVDLRGGVLLGERSARHRHLDLMDLHRELHVGEAGQLDLVAREALALELLARLALELGVDLVELVGREGRRDELGVLVHVEHVRGHHAERRPGGGEVAERDRRPGCSRARARTRPLARRLRRRTRRRRSRAGRVRARPSSDASGRPSASRRCAARRRPPATGSMPELRRTPSRSRGARPPRRACSSPPRKVSGL